jgi:zinc transport system substrate-binding protein
LNAVKNIPDVQVVNLVKPSAGEVHDIQLTPEQMELLEKASVFIMQGAGLESYIAKITSDLKKSKPGLKIILAGDGIPLIKDPVSGEPNPHLWVSLSDAVLEVRNIAEGLSAADSVHSNLYLTNAVVYIKKLETLRKKMYEALENMKYRDIVVFHDAFPYFARDFNLRIAASIERVPGTEPSASDLAEAIRLIKAKKNMALFAEPQYPPKAGEIIALETSLKLYYLDPGETGPMRETAYEEIMESNLNVLKEALK